jgi:hypothetical protein
VRDRTVAALLAFNRTPERLREVIGHVAATAGSSSHEMAATSEQAGKTTGEIAEPWATSPRVPSGRSG